MKNYLVVIELIRGYYKDENGDSDYDSPIIERKEFTVSANSEQDACNKAKELDTSHYSVWDSYADIIED